MNRSKLAALCLGTALLAGSALPAFAHDRGDRCERRIFKAERNLRNAERKHGEYSRQAMRRREELRRVREYCRR